MYCVYIIFIDISALVLSCCVVSLSTTPSAQIAVINNSNNRTQVLTHGSSEITADIMSGKSQQMGEKMEKETFLFILMTEIGWVAGGRKRRGLCLIRS